MKKLGTPAGYTAKNMPEQGAAKHSWGKKDGGNIVVENSNTEQALQTHCFSDHGYQPSSCQMGKSEERQNQARKP